MAFGDRRTLILCSTIRPCGYSDFPRWVSGQDLLPIGGLVGTNLSGVAALAIG